MIKSFAERAWEHYLYWESQDKKTLKRINALIKDAERHPFSGLGKPDPLKNKFSGAWSRRIDGANRFIYMVDEKNIYILSLKDHYD